MFFKNRKYSIARYILIPALLGGLFGAIFVTLTHAEPLVYRVAADGVTSDSCGADWSNPCDLQYVLNTLTTQSTSVEVWVAAGNYLPGIDRTGIVETGADGELDVGRIEVGGTEPSHPAQHAAAAGGDERRGVGVQLFASSQVGFAGNDGD